jgi:histidine phosphotransfer protein HptB
MMNTAASGEAIYSTLADDPDLGPLVEMYVSEMPDRLGTLLRRFSSGDLNGLATTAHQIKGAAGSHGFDQVTPYASRLEVAAREQRPMHEVGAALDALVDLCRRLRYR